MRWKHMLLSENAAGKAALPWAVGIVTNEVLADPPCISFLKCLPILEQPWLCWGATPLAALRPPSLDSGSPRISITLLSTFPSNGQLGDCKDPDWLSGRHFSESTWKAWPGSSSFMAHGQTLPGLFWSSRLLFFGLFLFNIQMFSVAEAKPHGLPGSNLSLTQPTKIIAMPRRMKALRRICSPSNTKYSLHAKPVLRGGQ